MPIHRGIGNAEIILDPDCLIDVILMFKFKKQIPVFDCSKKPEAVRKTLQTSAFTDG